MSRVQPQTQPREFFGKKHLRYALRLPKFGRYDVELLEPLRKKMKTTEAALRLRGLDAMELRAALHAAAVRELRRNPVDRHVHNVIMIETGDVPWMHLSDEQLDLVRGVASVMYAERPTDFLAHEQTGDPLVVWTHEHFLQRAAFEVIVKPHAGAGAFHAPEHTAKWLLIRRSR